MMLTRLSRRRILQGLTATALGGVLGTALAGCNQSAPVDAEGRVRLRLAVEGPARADHAGFYQAIGKGFYAARGLNVEISHGNSAADVSSRMASGTAELGVVRDSFAALRLVADRAPVKAVAAFFQKDPRVVIAHSNKGPRTLAAIGERPVYIEDADWADIWTWLRSKYALDDAQLRQPAEGVLEPFLADDTSLLIGSLTREPALVATSSPDTATRLLLPADDGYASYASILMTPNNFARDNTQALQDFIAASIEGWSDYLNEDPSKAHALIRRANPATPQGSLDIARDLLKEHAVTDSGDATRLGIGAMTAERWQAFAEQSAGSYAAEPDWQSAFTTDYLPVRK